VQLPRSLADELIAHAVADLPNECCGMIGGRDGRGTSVHRAANTEASPFMYVMDPREQLRIMDAIDDSGEDLLAIYHSHTRSAAYPSRTDVELAFFGRTLYVIVSLADPSAPEIRAFHLRRDQPLPAAITEEPVEILAD
jgi:proteasome lid subunit RPN8/RPN11